MEANRSRKRWTYEEYARLPMSGTTRYEVIDGKVAVTPSPTGWHQIVVGNLVRVLGNFVHDHALGQLFPGPIDVLFAEGDYFQPDLAFLGADRAHLLTKRGIEAPPDLVVEILSPSTAQRDRGVKLARYRHFGVSEYWIVDIDAKAVERWRLADGAESPDLIAAGDAIVWSPLAGGGALDLPVKDIFAGV